MSELKRRFDVSILGQLANLHTAFAAWSNQSRLSTGSRTDSECAVASCNRSWGRRSSGSSPGRAASSIASHCDRGASRLTDTLAYASGPADTPAKNKTATATATVSGKFIPGGTQIGQSPFAVYHSKETFGQDASLFSPERWINADPAKYEAMAEVVSLVFSTGQYQCLGKPVAFIELNKIFVELLRRFDLCTARPEKPLHIMNAGIWLIEDFPIRITRREA
ncbi:pisatin demethylase (cytochrome P450) [Fusarium agapanthi]|uniref:Pisatin demethylase (Cytochrome P450) n=1 Tax=Fusarium agapanthi TaxID=1803897 RepID=A0A9P5BHY3_9HYPO|nr:pisatin demethylase (cytochrome P450) [Fusarium agapanthi]